LNWATDFSNRLTEWVRLRQQVSELPPEPALFAINQWWFGVPWCPYYLHWDDWRDWPDPWQLLNDNIYCDVARGLGIMYTIAMLEREDLCDALMIDSGNSNLVLVQKEKYILNYLPDQIVNTNPGTIEIRRSITQEQLLYKFK
jgi:hypothetical protein